MKIKGSILIVALTMCGLEISSEENFDYSSREDVKEFIQEISSKHGFDRSKLFKLLSNAVYQEKVVRIMNRQPEGTMTWSRYKKMMVSESRLSAGEDFINLYRDELKLSLIHI